MGEQTQLSLDQQRAILWKMLEHARACAAQGMPITEARASVARLRDKFVQEAVWKAGREALTWSEATVERCNNRGERFAERGYVAEGTGLGYWVLQEEERTIYGVTHLASSLAITRLFEVEEHARSFIGQAHGLLDWTQTQEQIMADPRAADVDRQCQELGRAIAWEEDVKALAAELRAELPDLTDDEIERIARQW